MVRLDGEVVGQPGDPVPSGLSKEPSPDADFDNLVDYMKSTNAIVDKDEYDRLTGDDATAPVTVTNQGPSPVEAGDPTVTDAEKKAAQEVGKEARDAKTVSKPVREAE